MYKDMDNLSKTLFIAIFVGLLTPSLAFASWWNPFTWFNKKPVVIEKIIYIEATSTPTQSTTTVKSPIVDKIENKVTPKNVEIPQPTYTPPPVVKTPQYTEPAKDSVTNMISERLEEMEREKEEREDAERARKNSAACKTATAKVKKLSDEYNKYWGLYKTSQESEAKSEYLSKATDISLEQKDAQAEKYKACDNFVGSPTPTIFCTSIGNTVMCN